MLMKRKKLFIGLGILLVLALTAIGCSKSKHCSDPDYPYWCSNAKACCSYKYNDNHGTCWKTMEACRSSGYACSTCHLED